MTTTSAYSWQLLRAATFKLDAGSMFGLVPRVVWSRTVPCDDKARITVQHNCLLLKGGGRTILLETGTGDKMDPKSRDIFALESRSITDALAEIATPPDEIGAVVVSHLHFDHAGGLTRLARADEAPDWTGAGSAEPHGVKRTFPNAVVYTQEREWSDALANRSVMTRTYFRDHLEPIRDQVRLIDSPRPFPFGYIPDRAEAPKLPASDRMTEILPGVSVFLVPGHTWGQQATIFTDLKGRSIVFTPDVLPTAWHLGAAYSLGYDVEPYTSMISRTWLLAEAARNDWCLMLDHEPAHPLFRVRENSKGWYDLVPEPLE